MTANRFPATFPAALGVIRRHMARTVGLVLSIGIVSAAWWSWRRISLELTAVYDEGLRKAGIPEE